MTTNVNDCFFYIKNGANIKQGVISGGIPITRIETLANDTFNRDKMGYAGIHDKKKYTEYILQDGDILMSHINSMAYLGRAVMYKMQKNECIIHGMNLLRLKANRNLILPEYAEYYFKSNTFKKYINKIAKKSVNQASFSIADLKNIPLFLPNMVEQKEIYNTLNSIDNIISLKNQQLKQLDLLTKALFVEMFGDLTLNNKAWKFAPLSSICDVRDGTHDSPKASLTGYPLLTSKNFSSGFIDFKDCYFISESDFVAINRRSKVDKGDIIMPMIGTIGCPVIVNTNIKFAIKNVALIKFTKSQASNIFIQQVLSSDYFKMIICKNNRGNTQKFISLTDIRNLNIPIVPINEQNKFSQFISIIDKHKSVVQKSLDETQLLFDSLMQKYFG